MEQNNLHQKVIIAKRRKAKNPLVDKVFNPDLTKFQNYRINITVDGAYRKVVQPIFCKNPGHKTHFNVVFI